MTRKEILEMTIDFDDAINRIVRLENENIKLKKACEETQELLDKQIEATYKLDKENAELKKDKKELCHSISEGGKACVYLNEQLTKGKVLLKQLVDAFPKSYSDVVKDTLDEARKFVEE